MNPNLVFEFPGFIGSCTDAGYLRDLALSIGKRIAELGGGNPFAAAVRMSAGDTPGQSVAPLMAALGELPGVGATLPEAKTCEPFDVDELADRVARRVANVLGMPYPEPYTTTTQRPIFEDDTPTSTTTNPPPGGPFPVPESPPTDVKPGE